MLPTIKIVYEGDRDSAFNKEIELIKKYGRSNLGTGSLTNLTDGGYIGNYGLKFSDKSRQKNE